MIFETKGNPNLKFAFSKFPKKLWCEFYSPDEFGSIFFSEKLKILKKIFINKKEKCAIEITHYFSQMCTLKLSWFYWGQDTYWILEFLVQTLLRFNHLNLVS